LADFFADGQSLRGNGVFVEVGGNTPQSAVTQKFLRHGWTGLIVEPIQDNAEALRQAGWPVVEQVALTSPELAKLETCTFHLAGEAGAHSSLALSGIHPQSRQNKTIQVKLSTLEDLLQKHHLHHINLLSIDTEGTELEVLRGLEFSKHEIDIILCEDWHRDSKIHRYLSKQGYKIILRTGFNSWYIPRRVDIPLPMAGKMRLFKKIYISSHYKRFHHYLLSLLSG
jgi:FkbM family methyltransferase